MSTRPSQSPSLWSGLISHLRSSVTVKRRRVHLKSHSDCFLGSEAVDVVAGHINHVLVLEGADVPRDKVVCVCQALLDCNVFEAVATKVFGKDKKQNAFQDSKSISTLVKVTPTFTKANQPETHVPASPSSEDAVDSVSLSPSRVPTDSEIILRIFALLLVVDEVWQEETFLRLLNLVDLPLLEGVLQCSRTPSSPPPSQMPAHNNPDLIYSSNHLDRQILKAFRETQEDEMLCAALDCLDFLSDQPVVELSRDGVAQCKLLLYRALLKHYSHTDRPPLLPQYMSDICTAITDLLVNAKLDKALEALQLCLKLLPPSCREELRRLLTFMSLAADPQEIKLDKEIENKLAVKRSFTRAIIYSKSLSKEKEDLIVSFMLSNIQEIFKIPGALHKGVSDKLANLVHGTQPETTGSMFCQQVSSRTFTDSTKTTTNQELRTLLNSIHENTTISAKERKRLLRQFYQAHPEIFNQYFGDSAVSVL
uniref:DEP domain-containing protein 7 n=1 Tax=Echeneis naucrates TaxID=173247 RepID=A0A665TKZ1_ECHNA